MTVEEAGVLWFLAGFCVGVLLDRHLERRRWR